MSLELTQAETDLLVKACKEYRAGIPAYLKAYKGVVAALDALIIKLSANATGSNPPETLHGRARGGYR